MAKKVTTGDKVAYTPRKADGIAYLTDGKAIGKLVSELEDDKFVLETRGGQYTVKYDRRRFTKLTDEEYDSLFPATPAATSTSKPAEAEKAADDKADASTSTSKPAKKAKPSKTTKPREGSKKARAIAIFKEVNGRKTKDLDRKTVISRFVAELKIGAQGASTYYQNIKSRKSGWWF